MRAVLRRLALPLLAGWVVYSLGYTDPHGRFVLAVNALRSDDRAACERLRAHAVDAGWFVLPHCVRDDEGPVQSDAERAGHRETGAADAD